jgi:hypothetical protein
VSTIHRRPVASEHWEAALIVDVTDRNLRRCQCPRRNRAVRLWQIGRAGRIEEVRGTGLLEGEQATLAAFGFVALAQRVKQRTTDQDDVRIRAEARD